MTLIYEVREELFEKMLVHVELAHMKEYLKTLFGKLFVLFKEGIRVCDYIQCVVRPL